MKNEPDIVKALKEEESSGKLQQIHIESKPSTEQENIPEEDIEIDKNNDTKSNFSSVSKDALHILMNLINDPVVIVNRKGKILEVSDKVEEKTGTKKEELIGKNFLKMDFITAKSKATLIKNLTKRMLGQKIDTYIAETISENGEILSFEVKGIKIEYNNKPADIVIFRDISREKKTENALHESEERFRIAAKSVSDVIWEWDIKTGRLDWFGHIDEMLGYAPNEFPRTIKAWEGILHPDDEEKVNELLKRHLQLREPYIAEYRVFRKDNTIRHWIDRGTALWDENGQAFKMIGACSDITEHKNAEEALRENEEKYKFLVDNSMEIIIIIGKTGKILFVNKKAIDVSGYSEEEIIGKPINCFLTEDSIEKVLFALSEEFLDHPQPASTIKIKTKNGEIRVIELSEGSVPVSEKGEKVGVLINALDVTDRERVEEILREKIDELEKFQKITVDRELKMIELKNEVNALCEKYKEKPRYELK